MTIEQYSVLCRALGFLDGIGATLRDNVAENYYTNLDILTATIDEIWKEEQDG